MRVSGVNSDRSIMRRAALKSAAQGALMTGGIMTASQAYSWLRNKDTMNRLAQQYGGKSAYFKQFALGTAGIMAVSALLSAAMPYIANKIAPVEPPRAAN